MTEKKSFTAVNVADDEWATYESGNSDGDYAMLQWTTTATGYPLFGMIAIILTPYANGRMIGTHRLATWIKH